MVESKRMQLWKTSPRSRIETHLNDIKHTACTNRPVAVSRRTVQFRTEVFCCRRLQLALVS